MQLAWESGPAKIAAAAIALIIKGLNLPGQTAPSTVEPDTWQFSEQGIHTQDHQGRSSLASDSYEDGVGETLSYINGFVGTLSNTIEGERSGHTAQAQGKGPQEEGSRARASGFLRHQPLKTGQTTWLTGYLRNVAKTYFQENHAYTTMKSFADKMKHGPKIELLEIFAGSATLST